MIAPHPERQQKAVSSNAVRIGADSRPTHFGKGREQIKTVLRLQRKVVLLACIATERMSALAHVKGIAMNLYIDSVSALNFYSTIATSLDDETLPCYKDRIDDAACSKFRLKEFDLSNVYVGSGKLHVMVGNQSNRTPSDKIVCHVQSKQLPWGALRSLGENVFVASPELCFYELARVLSFPKLVECGYFVCGSYHFNPNVEKKNDRAPLTTKRKLASFADRMPDQRGKAIVKKALELVGEGSASVRETKTAMLLTFPIRLGGYGFAKPVLNHRIDFTLEEQRLFGRPFVILDLYWPEYGFGIEYDGGESHEGEKQLSSDRRKDSELAYRGITVFRVDKNQLNTLSHVHALAVKSARMMGVRVRKPTQKQWAAKQALFDCLMK